MSDHVDPYAALPARPLDPARFTAESTYAPTRLPVELASTLIPDAYTSPDFFALEQEKVFANSWVAVGMASDVDPRPGACLVVEVAGRSIVITRNAGGALRAFHNVCRHRGTRLLDADARDVGRRGRIRCPYHSWTYDTDGACLGTPMFEDSGVPEQERPVFDTTVAKGFDRADYGLLPVAVDTWGCFLFVHLGTDPPPLTAQLGDLPRRFRDYRLDAWLPQRRRTYDVAANYKLVGENFMEYYHLPSVHPELSRVSRFADHYRWQGPGMYTGMCTTPVSRNTEAGGWDGLRPLSSLSGTDAESGRFVWLFPGTALSVLPNHAFVLLNRPVGPDRTVETAVLLSHPEALDDPGAAAGIDQLAAFWDLVNRQDLEIVERVQEGLGNPAYRGGRLCYRFEEPLHRFQNMIIDRMLGVDRVPAGDDDCSEVNLADRDR